MVDKCDKNILDAIKKGRSIASTICKNIILYKKIDDAITVFLDYIYNLVLAYANYLYDTKRDTYGSFFVFKINEYCTEININRISKDSLDSLNSKSMFIKIMLLDNLMPNDRSTEYSMDTNSQKKGQCGQNIRSFDNLLRIVTNTGNDVNIREKLSLIYNFRFSCALMWDVIKIYYDDIYNWDIYFSNCFDIINFKGQLDKMSKYLEIDMRDVVKICQQLLIDDVNIKSKGNAAIGRQIGTLSKCFQKPGSLLMSLCALVFLPVSRQVFFGRVYPEGVCRKSVTKCIPLKIRDIIPKLSENEKDFMRKFDKIDNLDNKDTEIRWQTGKSCYDVLEESFLNKFYSHNNKPMITGPSGTMDLLMTFANYFPLDVYTKQLISLGIIVWMAVPPDHSIFEMLSVLPSHGVIDYNQPIECEYDYVIEMIKHLSKEKTLFRKVNGNQISKSYCTFPYDSNSDKSNSGEDESNSGEENSFIWRGY